MTYFFHPAAEAEHLETIAYYESKRPGLGAIYLTELESIIEHICENPHRYAIEKPLLAVAHHRRRPQYWLGRL